MASSVDSTPKTQKVIQASRSIETYDLAGILPGGYQIALKEYQIMRGRPATHCAIVTIRGNAPTYDVLDNCIFTYTETLVLRPLLKYSPYYAPYEDLYVSFVGGAISREQARKELGEALHGPRFDELMRPIRNIISRVRLKLHAFDIDVLSLIETGYVLTKRTKHRSVRRQSASA